MIGFGNLTDRIWQGWAYLSSGGTLLSLVGIGFAVLAILLFAASRTRWGHSKPLTKCIILSVLAHVWILMYMLGHRPQLPQGDLNGKQDGLIMAFETVDDLSFQAESSEPMQVTHEWEQPVALTEIPLLQELFEQDTPAWDDSKDILSEVEVTPLAPLEESDVATEDTLVVTSHDEPESSPSEPRPILPQPLEVRGNSEPQGLLTSTSSAIEPALEPLDSLRVSIASEDYQLRSDKNRLALVRAFGADEDTEAAVEAALKWLSLAQSTSGSWISAKFGGGTETYALGEYRYGTGDRADTGVTGLALLAFLSSGHTHLEGQYHSTVQSGLAYLMREQMPSGDLSGHKQVGNDHSVVNARMYCHSIAMLALAEAYAMTHDHHLRDSLLKAAQYSINSQDSRGGGWRYRPGESGDLSLFGWKAMAIRSVQRSGIEVPSTVLQRMNQFIDSCAAGRYGGLARYRPAEGSTSPTMTAESLACRLLLRLPISREAQYEATSLVMSHIPGSQPDNVYLWYYATLALFQLQNEDWRSWNQALKTRLLQTQCPAYHQHPGSWDPDGVWGGYGGRVYSTAMSCLCLEVYYRYLPMYR